MGKWGLEAGLLALCPYRVVVSYCRFVLKFFSTLAFRVRYAVRRLIFFLVSISALSTYHERLLRDEKLDLG